MLRRVLLQLEFEQTRILMCRSTTQLASKTARPASVQNKLARAMQGGRKAESKQDHQTRTSRSCFRRRTFSSVAVSVSGMSPGRHPVPGGTNFSSWTLSPGCSSVSAGGLLEGPKTL